MRIILLVGIAAMVAGCATAAKLTLQDRFKAIGLSPQMADCMVDDLQSWL